jgi:peptide/nickel transport system substrate-binding protein
MYALTVEAPRTASGASDDDDTRDDTVTRLQRRGPTRRVVSRLIATAAVAALALTGCSIQVRSQPDPGIGAATMLINADHGQPQFDRNFNPYLANSRTAAKWMYEPLIEINPLDGTKTPWLASKWSLPNPSTIDMTIRSGVKWSDGAAFSADDVKFTFDLLKKYPALDTKGAWQHIQSLEVDGDHVIFHLKTADVPSLAIIGATYQVSEHRWSTVKDPTTYRDPDPVGTGPFVLGKYNPLQYSMDKNPKYWQADKIEIQHLILPATNNQLDTVTRGYDWSYSFISNVKGTWGAASPNNKWWFPAGGIISLIPNLAVKPFDDVNVRKGISLALDREKIADTATEGYMTAAGQSGLLLPNQEDVLNPDIPDQGMITQDQKAALAEFAKSGYTQQGGKLVDKTGKQFSFTITTANGYTDWTRAVQEAQKQLTAIGIQVKVNAPQPAGYQAALNNGKYEVAMGGMGGGDVFQAYNNLLSSEFYQPVGKATQNNLERYKDPATDRLLAQYKSSVDPEKQKQIGYELQKVIYDQVPVIGMYYGGLWGLYNDAKFTGWPTAKDPYMAPQNYDSAPLLIFTKLRLAKGGQG